MFGRRKDDGPSASHERSRASAESDPREAADAHAEKNACCSSGGSGEGTDCCSPGAHAGAGGSHEIGGPDETQSLIDTLAHERDDFKDKWLRAMAEYQNFQRRAIQNEQEAKRQGITSVLMSVVPVLDSLDMALTNAAAKAGTSTAGPEAAGTSAPDTGEAHSASAMTEGVRAVQQGLLAALGAHGVSVIRPAPGDVFDPNQHSAIVQMPGVQADGSPIEAGRVSQTLQVGYALHAHGQDRVIRSAKVAVVPG